VTKLQLLESFRAQEKLKWSDPWLEAQDLEYHQIDPERSLGLALADLSGPWADSLDDEAILKQPPEGSRAAVRGKLMRRIAESDEPYEIDWHRVEYGKRDPIVLLDPFQSQVKR
jgi:proteasome accessory factor A